MTEPLDSKNVLLLVRLAELLDVPYDRGTALRHIDASRRQCASKENASSATFAMACGRAGLRVVSFRADFEQALERATRETPLVARARSNRDTSAVILDRMGKKVLALLEPVGEPSWISEKELAEHLELDRRDLNTEWFIVHAAASAAAAVAPGGGEVPPPLKRLFAILRPDRSDLWAVGVFAIVIGSLMLATPVAVQALVNFVAFGGSVAPVVVLALMLSVGLGFAAGLSALQTWIVEILQRRVFVRMVADLAHRLPRIHRATQNQSYGPELVNRFFDVITVQKMSSFLLLDGISVALGVVLGLVVLAFYHPLLLAFDLLIILAVLAIVYLLGPNGIQTAIRESRTKYAVAGWLEDIARSPFTFRAPGAREFVLHRADELSREYVNVRSTHYRILFRQIVAMLVLQTAASVALLGIGGVLVIRGELTLGQLVASELIVTYVVGSIAKMGKHFEAYYDLMAAVDKIGNLLDLRLERTTGDAWTEIDRHDPRGANVCLKNVNLTTPFGRSLFSDFNLEIEPGARLAVTGGNGSGKSTLAELLYGTLDPNRGRIEIDGLDSQSLRLESLRENVALVAGHEVFAGTVLDNVQLGRSLSTEAVHEALKNVGLLNACAALPEGVRTQITSSGMPLTESQIIRLMLARAIVGKPRLLIIDSLLDNLSSDGLAHILDSITAADAPWSLVILSNRREVLNRCDRTLDLSPTPQPERRAV